MTDSTDSLPQAQGRLRSGLRSGGSEPVLHRAEAVRLPHAGGACRRAEDHPWSGECAKPAARVTRCGCSTSPAGTETIGALLRHDLSMADLYARYGDRQWRPVRCPEVLVRRLPPSSPPGARHGHISRSAASTSPGSPWSTPRRSASSIGPFTRTSSRTRRAGSWSVSFDGVDLVVESGSLGDLLPGAFERILDVCGAAARPWFIYCPRPDVDWAPLIALWAERGYRTESLGAGTNPLSQGAGGGGAGGHASGHPGTREAGRGGHA